MPEQSEFPLEPAPTSGRRLLGIEGLRGAAAISVMLGHFNLHLVPVQIVPRPIGHVLNVAGQGLTLFFVLSGFLLFGPFMTAAARGTPFKIANYFQNRILRIYPAYIAIFVIVALVLGLAYTRAVTATDGGVRDTAETIGRMNEPSAILANLFLVHTLLPSTIKTGLGVSWSLTTEICFYLALPLLAVITVRLGRRTGLNRAAIIVTCGMIAVGLICRGVGEAQLHGDAATRFYLEWGDNWLAVFLRSILCQADLFGVGMMAVIVSRASAGLVTPAARRGFRQALYGAALLGLVLTRLDPEFGYAMFFAALLLIVTTKTSNAHESRLSSFLEWSPVRWLGVVSYSFYLWHLPVIWAVYKWYLHGQLPHSWAPVALAYALVLCVTVALSSVTYLAIERPALLLKVKPQIKRPIASTALPAGESRSPLP